MANSLPPQQSANVMRNEMAINSCDVDRIIYHTLHCWRREDETELYGWAARGSTGAVFVMF